MDPVMSFQIMLVLMQLAAFILGMKFQSRLDEARKKYEE